MAEPFAMNRDFHHSICALSVGQGAIPMWWTPPIIWISKLTKFGTAGAAQGILLGLEETFLEQLPLISSPNHPDCALSSC